MQSAVERRSLVSEGTQATKEFSINLGAHMLQVLSGLYSDIHWAIVREYGTNMLDGYTELRRNDPTAPIIPPRIKLPSADSPFLEFIDYGAGMSWDRVWGVYSKYGASTKQGNNDEVGGLGLGSKVAFAYEHADQWNVESRYNGERMTFNAAKNEYGIPVLLHVETVPTYEPNGVTVRIPVPSHEWRYFHDPIRQLKAYYPMDLVIEAGSDFEYTAPEIFTRGQGWVLRKEGRDSKIVMGNVPYPLEPAYLSYEGAGKFLRDNWGAISVDFYVGVGEMDIVPSREAIKYTDRTKSRLNRAVKEFMDGLTSNATSAIQSAPTRWEALKMLYSLWGINDMRALLKTVQWRGEDLNPLKGIECSLTLLETKFPGVLVDVYQAEGSKYQRGLMSHDGSWNIAPNEKCHIFIDDTNDAFDTPAKVKYFLETHYVKQNQNTGYRRRGRRSITGGAGYAYVLREGKGLTAQAITDLLGGHPVEGVTSSLPKRPPKPRTGGTRTPTSLKLYGGYSHRGRGYQWHDATANIEDGGYYIRIEANEWMDGHAGSFETITRLARELHIIPMDAVVYGIPRTRKSVEKKPGWVDFRAHTAAKVEKLVMANAEAAAEVQSWKDVNTTRIIQWAVRHRKALPKGSLLRTLVAEMQQATRRSQRVHNVTALAGYLNIRVKEVRPKTNGQARLNEVYKQYPLLRTLDNMAIHTLEQPEHTKAILDYLRLGQ